MPVPQRKFLYDFRRLLLVVLAKGITIIISHTYSSSSVQTLVCNSSRTVYHKLMKEAIKSCDYWGEVWSDFYKRSGVRWSLQWAKNRPKNPIDFCHCGQLWRVVAPRENFVETCESPHLKRLSSCARTLPRRWGISCTPGAQEKPKVAP